MTVRRRTAFLLTLGLAAAISCNEFGDGTGLNDQVAIETTTLPGGVEGQAYSQQLTAVGGTGGYSWALGTGALPDGLSLSTDGTISGTPTTAGTAAFEVTVSDGAGRGAAADLSITIIGALAVETATLADGVVAASYGAQLEASGGQGTYTWSLDDDGGLTWLALSASGALTGVPTGPADGVLITVGVADESGQSATAELAVTVRPALVIETGVLPPGVVDAAYETTLSAVGGQGSFAWTVSGGSLPAGLSLSAAGVISGTPTAAGTSTFTVEVGDEGGQSASAELELVVTQPLVLLTETLPDALEGRSYEATLDATGGVGSHVWSVVSGSLPPGIELSVNGALVGVATTPGTFPFTVEVADEAGVRVTGDFSITVLSVPTIQTTTLPPAIVNEPYGFTLEATGGTGAYTWSLSVGMPPGMGMSSAGVIGGTPGATGVFTFTVFVEDEAGERDMRELSIAVAEPLVIDPEGLPDGILGQPYDVQLQATGGSGAHSWAIIGGGLPPGLGLTADGGLTGTPTEHGIFVIVVEVTDEIGLTDTEDFSLKMIEALVIQTASLPAGVVDQPYDFTLEAAGGTPPYSWSVTATLPPGLGMSTDGVFTGTPTATGTFDMTVAVMDQSGQEATADLSLAVAQPLEFEDAVLPPAIQGQAYDIVIQMLGGAGDLTFAIIDGALPPGLSLSAEGVLLGAPTDFGTFGFTVQVSDESGQTVTHAYSINVIEALVVQTTTVPDGVVGQPYEVQLQATGGTGAYTWGGSSGRPPGVGLTGFGLLTGTPTAGGEFEFFVVVSDEGGQTSQADFVMTVVDPNAISIDTDALPTGTETVLYDVQLTASGGIGSHSWTLLNGALPPGISLSPAGAISGTPTRGGTWDITVGVSDDDGRTDSRDLSLTINGIPEVPIGIHPGFGGAAGTTTIWKVVVPPGASYLDVAMSGGSGDVDLYVRYALRPGLTDNQWDCRPFLVGNNETCPFDDPAAGNWYFVLHAFEAYAGATLLVDHDGPIPPRAEFSVVCGDLVCGFIDESTDSDGTVDTWDWDFGDGAGSTAQEPDHTYAVPGTYTVTLTVTNDDGVPNTHTEVLTVPTP